MRSQKHFFASKTEVEKVHSEVTIEATRKEMEHRPSATVVGELKERLAAKGKHWEKWLEEKEAIDAQLKFQVDEEVRLYWEERLRNEELEKEKHRQQEEREMAEKPGDGEKEAQENEHDQGYEEVAPT